MGLTRELKPVWRSGFLSRGVFRRGVYLYFDIRAGVDFLIYDSLRNGWEKEEVDYTSHRFYI